MNKYEVTFRFKSGAYDQHILVTDDGVFSGWDSEIRKDGTIRFHDVDGDRITINTKHLETYLAKKV